MGTNFYPKGGANDIIDNFDRIDECFNKLNSIMGDIVKERYADGRVSKERIESEWRNDHWGHILDTQTGKVVWNSARTDIKVN